MHNKELKLILLQFFIFLFLDVDVDVDVKCIINFYGVIICQNLRWS